LASGSDDFRLNLLRIESVQPQQDGAEVEGALAGDEVAGGDVGECGLRNEAKRRVKRNSRRNWQWVIR
jgi:hypothetical protein